MTPHTSPRPGATLPDPDWSAGAGESCPTCTEADWLLMCGEHWDQVAARLHLTPASLTKHLQRHGRARPGRPATAPRMPDLTGGLCRTRPDLPWHPDGNTPPALVREALQLCTRCPVMVPCGAYALKVPQDGIWGGMTQHTRDRIRHDRRANP